MVVYIVVDYQCVRAIVNIWSGDFPEKRRSPCAGREGLSGTEAPADVVATWIHSTQMIARITPARK